MGVSLESDLGFMGGYVPKEACEARNVLLMVSGKEVWYMSIPAVGVIDLHGSINKVIVRK